MPCIRFTSYGYVSCAQNQVSYYCCIGGSRPEHLNPSLMLEEEQGLLREHRDWPLLATLSLFPFPPLYLLSGSKVQGCHEALSHLCWKAVSFSGSNGLCSPLSTLAPPARNKWPSFTNLWLLVLVCLACTWEGQSLPWRVYHQNSKEWGWKTTSVLHLIPGDGSMQRSNLSMETVAGPLGPDMHLPLSKKKGDLPLSSKSNPS